MTSMYMSSILYFLRLFIVPPPPPPPPGCYDKEFSPFEILMSILLKSKQKTTKPLFKEEKIL